MIRGCGNRTRRQTQQNPRKNAISERDAFQDARRTCPMQSLKYASDSLAEDHHRMREAAGLLPHPEVDGIHERRLPHAAVSGGPILGLSGWSDSCRPCRYDGAEQEFRRLPSVSQPFRCSGPPCSRDLSVRQAPTTLGLFVVFVHVPGLGVAVSATFPGGKRKGGRLGGYRARQARPATKPGE